MLVVIANDLPPAVRGRMKLWFVEPKPNVFVSGVKDAVADEVVDYLFSNCPLGSGLIIFQKISKPPGYKIRTLGFTEKALCLMTGLQLVKEKEALFFDNKEVEDA